MVLSRCFNSYVRTRETNSKSSYSARLSLRIKVRPETIGSEINTPPPNSCTCQACSGSLGSKATSSISAGFPWKSTRSPFLISSPDRYFSGVFTRSSFRPSRPPTVGVNQERRDECAKAHKYQKRGTRTANISLQPKYRI